VVFTREGFGEVIRTRIERDCGVSHNPIVVRDQRKFKMIRLLHIDDPQLRERVRAKIAAGREMESAHIPDWWEMDDADFSVILIELRREDEDEADDDFD
jgi:hypothetical protein